MAFRRFASLRGHPSNYWSDRGTNFVGAQSYLNETLQGWNIPQIRSVYKKKNFHVLFTGSGTYHKPATKTEW